MIDRTLQFSMLIAIAVYFALLLHLLRKRSLNLKYTLLWLLSGCIMLLLAVFPGLLDSIAGVVGIYEPANALFAVMFFCVIIILVSLTAIVSKLSERVKRLAQSIALLDAKTRETDARHE